MAAKKKAARRAAPAGGRRKCVVFRKTAKKGGRRMAPKTVCFAAKELSPAKKAAKKARAKKVLRDFACKAAGAPKKACNAIRRGR
jgi:hypothetical protein